MMMTMKILPFGAIQWFTPRYHMDGLHWGITWMVYTGVSHGWFTLGYHKDDLHWGITRMVYTGVSQGWFTLGCYIDDLHQEQSTSGFQMDIECI